MSVDCANRSEGSNGGLPRSVNPAAVAARLRNLALAIENGARVIGLETREHVALDAPSEVVVILRYAPLIKPPAQHEAAIAEQIKGKRRRRRARVW